jgi:hypothetical protein
MGAYKALREGLRRQVEEQVQRGNLNFMQLRSGAGETVFWRPGLPASGSVMARARPSQRNAADMDRLGCIK